MTLFPPRPKSRILPTQLDMYERSGKWIAQRKFNGTHLTIHVKDGDVAIYNYGEVPQLFVLTPKHKQEILSLDIDRSKEYWFDGELLDHKTVTPDYKGKIVLFDILQAGRKFFGSSSPNFLERYALLASICRNPTVREPNNGIALAASASVWLAENFTNEFALRYEEFIDHPEIEGLVLKRKKNSHIDSLGATRYETGWLIRCRKPHKNYQF
jgi:hypothetical protein